MNSTSRPQGAKPTTAALARVPPPCANLCRERFDLGPLSTHMSDWLGQNAGGGSVPPSAARLSEEGQRELHALPVGPLKSGGYELFAGKALGRAS